MRLRATLLALGATLACGAMATAADAACTRLAFSVNDYGKVGPAKDAQKLLDTYIAKWTAERGIAKYTTGKKDVTCELFLDVGLFDEYTCKAAASVCWEGNKVPVDAAAPAMGVKTKAATAPAAPGAPKAAAKTTPNGIVTGTINKVVPKAPAAAVPAAAVPAVVAPAAAAAPAVVAPAAVVPAAPVPAPAVVAPAAPAAAAVVPVAPTAPVPAPAAPAAAAEAPKQQ